MRQSLVSEENRKTLSIIKYIVGNADIICNMPAISARIPFDDEIIAFLDSLSKKLMKSPEAKAYPDVITLGFWMRRSNIFELKRLFMNGTEDFRVGRGVAFHIAPSNVPVNYAYSLLTGLLTGNANIVRIPSKDFPQVSIVNQAVAETLKSFPGVAAYICLIRYDRDQNATDLLSQIADTRIVWGGDHTIAEIRNSPLGPRAGEITFADRYSLAVIDSESYLAHEDKKRLAYEFYNDTFLSDQNACTSPRIIVWLGNAKKKAKREFWEHEHVLVKEKYHFQPIMAINKLSSGYIAAAAVKGAKIVSVADNYICRVQVPKADVALMEYKENSGFFFEYDCENIMEIRDLCDNSHCQTMAFLGNKEQLLPLLTSGIKGIDRIVPIGKTMDFDLIWDGYDLVERLTRLVKINI